MGKRFDPRTLDDYMKNKPLKVAHKNSSYPIQNELFKYSSDKTNYGYRARIGAFYEILTSSIFGGRWFGTNNAAQNGETLFQPDVMSKATIIESKSVCWKESLKLVDFQIDKYLLQQCTDFYQTPRRIFFSIFKYDVKSPLSYFKQSKENHLDEIVKTLSKNTAFLMFLPFSIISALHDPEGNISEEKKNYFSRYEDQRFDTLTRLKATGMKAMMLNPEEVLKTYGLKPEDYLIVKTKLPKKVKMNSYEITPFPILFIEDKDYDGWLMQFKEKNSCKVALIKKEEKKKKDYFIKQGGCSDIDEEKPDYSGQLFADEVPF